METSSAMNATASEGGKLSFAAVASNALRYWELRRIVYNLVLAVIVLGYFVDALPKSKSLISMNSVLGLAVLVVLANLCYCAAYVVDVFVQFSGLRESWLKMRWVLFLIGLGFAAILTRFFAMGFFQVLGQ